jgi:DNA-directed RNA polymerase
MEYAKKYSVAEMARDMTMLAKHRQGIEDDKWSDEKCLNIGDKLFDLAEKCIMQTHEGKRFTLFAKERRNAGTRQDIVLLRFTQEASDWLFKGHERCALMAPLHLPMVVKPNAWTSPFNGGYYTHRTTLVKTRSRGYLEELFNKPEQMDRVYRATNLLQETPYKINPGVLRVLKQCWEMGGGLAGLPSVRRGARRLHLFTKRTRTRNLSEPLLHRKFGLPRSSKTRKKSFSHTLLTGVAVCTRFLLS